MREASAFMTLISFMYDVEKY